MSKTVKLMVIWYREAKEAFEIGTDHDNRGNQVTILLEDKMLFACHQWSIKLWYPEFKDHVGQGLSFSQCASEKFQSAATFPFVFLQRAR